jgi:hypothetical protein
MGKKKLFIKGYFMTTWKEIGRDNARAANRELRYRSQEIASQNHSDLLSDLVQEVKDIKLLLSEMIELLRKRL